MRSSHSSLADSLQVMLLHAMHEHQVCATAVLSTVYSTRLQTVGLCVLYMMYLHLVPSIQGNTLGKLMYKTVPLG